MSQNPNDNAANNANTPPGQLPAYPGAPTATPPASGGLKSNLKIAVPLVALVGVVFGVTYLSMYTTPKPPGPEKSEGPHSNEPPLRFFTSGRFWNAPNLSAPGYKYFPLLAPPKVPSSAEGDAVTSYSLQDRLFQGFYEPGDKNSPMRRTQFWFENRNDKPVKMKLQGVSCSSCSGARLAAIPPETTTQLLQHTAIASLPLGPFNGFGVGLVQPAASLSQLSWTERIFANDPNAEFEVPAALAKPDKWTEQWGILELNFRVGDKTHLQARFGTQVEGTSQKGENSFAIAYEVANGLDVDRAVIDVGEISPLSIDSTHQLIVYSSTRGPGSEFGPLDVPSCLVQAPLGVTDPVKFVEVTKIERIPDSELMSVADSLKKPTQVRTAYRVTIAVRPKVGETRMDLGQLERIVSVSVPGVTRQVSVKALVRGSVWVDNNPTEIILPSFRGADGTTKSPFLLNLTTEAAGMELVVLKDECEVMPKQHRQRFEFELIKQPDRGAQGHYKLKFAISPGVFGEFTGVVVLEVKGPIPQRIRIPFKGGSTL